MSSRGTDENIRKQKKRVVETEADQIATTASVFKRGVF